MENVFSKNGVFSCVLPPQQNYLIYGLKAAWLEDQKIRKQNCLCYTCHGCNIPQMISWLFPSTDQLWRILYGMFQFHYRPLKCMLL